MEPPSALDARTLGQLLLMQSVLGNLPDESSIARFVCRGLVDVPGVAEASLSTDEEAPADAERIHVPLLAGSSRWGALSIRLSDPAAFAPYEPYLKNFSFMLAVILEARHQRRLIEAHSVELERRVAERTANLEAASAALRDSEGRFRSVLETMPLIGVMVDRTGAIMLCNDAVLGLTGWTRDEVLHRNWFELFIPPEIRTRVYRDVFLASVGAGEVPAHFEHEIVTRSGERRLIAWSNTMLRDHAGAVIGVASIGEDITARNRAEAARQEAEAKQRAMIANIADVIAVIDQGGINRYKSPNIERWFGWRPEEVVGVSTWDNVHPDDLGRTQVFFAGLLSQPDGFAGTAECRYRCKDGGYKWIEFTGVNRLHDPEIQGVLLNYHDITERKRASEENAALQSQLSQAQKMDSVGRLAGGVAHDFNNMLSVILGNAELAISHVAADHPIQVELAEILSTARRSADLTRQLLAFARKQTITPKVLDLNETIEGMLKMLRRLIGEDIELVWKPAADLWPAKIDPAQVDQIMANLALNARDAIGSVGQVSVATGNVELDEASCAGRSDCVPGEYVTLVVSDDGCGMDTETLAHVFEPFFTTKSTGKGTGLGLATVFGIVSQNRGFIETRSAPGEGTTLSIFLPRHAGNGVETPAASPFEVVEGGRETILVVEDEPSVLRLTTTVLDQLGYTVLAAATPGEAIRIADAHRGRIDLLMTDVVMPEMNGRELAARLQAACPTLKCLFASGYTADVIAHHGVLEDSVKFIQKPFGLTQLAAKVRRTLAEP